MKTLSLYLGIFSLIILTNSVCAQFTLPPNDGSVVNCVDDGLVQPAGPGPIMDGCSNMITPTVTAPNPVPCVGDMVWTFTYVGCNETHYWTYTYSVMMSSPLTAPPAATSTVNCPADAIDPGAPMDIVDGCGNLVSAVLSGFIDNPSPLNCEGTRTWNYTYTDCAGNNVSWTYTYTVDMPNFIIGIPNGSSTVITVGETNVAPTPPTVNDACGNTIIPTVVGVSNTPGTNDYIWDFIYTDCAGNVADWSHTYTVDSTSSTASIDIEDIIIIYPNPTSNFIEIDSKINENYSYIIRDIRGAVIISNASILEKELIDLRDLDPGTYFISVTSSMGTVVQKLIKE